MNPIYSLDIEKLQQKSGIPIKVVESEIDLYYHMALSMYREIEQRNSEKKRTSMILPVGPVFQYRRFCTLLEFRPLDLSNLHIFFMDEYLDPGTDRAIPIESPLSFQGFINKELIAPLNNKFDFDPKQIHFPNPATPDSYDRKIESLEGIDLCHAGVGIVGHLAFNEPISKNQIGIKEFKKLPTRVVNLTRETITINSNTALRGAFEEVPNQAVTVGMDAILSSRKLEIYMNRHWQASVLRKALMLKPTTEFPITCAQDHPRLSFSITPLVAEVPDLALK